VVKPPVADVYRRWLVFEDYSKFVTAIKRARKLDANRFVASLGFNGKQYHTTAFACIVRQLQTVALVRGARRSRNSRKNSSGGTKNGFSWTMPPIRIIG
jgi:hypothetical protein